jgi:hypothetical protein
MRPVVRERSVFIEIRARWLVGAILLRLVSGNVRRLNLKGSAPILTSYAQHRKHMLLLGIKVGAQKKPTGASPERRIWGRETSPFVTRTFNSYFYSLTKAELSESIPWNN